MHNSYFYFYRKGQSLHWPPEPELSDSELEAGFNFIQYLADHILFFASPFRDFFINTFQINNTVGLTHGWHPTASLDQISDIAKSSALDLHNMSELFEKSDDINIEKRLQNFPEELEFKGGPAFTSLLHYLKNGNEMPLDVNPELIELLIETLEGFHLTEEIKQRLREVFKILIVY